jgi:recombination protein RecT
MSTVAKTNEDQPANIRLLVQSPDVMARINEVLGKRGSTFAASVVQLVNQATALKGCEPKSVLNCAMVAATLDLSINPQLGQAWVVPYGKTAQFQLGVKGLKQLAMRSGQFLRLNNGEVYENQFISFNPMTEELIVDFTKEPEGNVVGYFAYMKLLNGFEKTVYWPMEKVKKHGQKYSKTFNNGPWKTEFDKMAMKTVMKAMLNSGEAPLSIEMQRAMEADQAVIKDVSSESFNADYPDNAQEEFQTGVVVHTQEEEEEIRVIGLINSANSLSALEKIIESLPEELKEKHLVLINERREKFVAE